CFVFLSANESEEINKIALDYFDHILSSEDAPQSSPVRRLQDVQQNILNAIISFPAKPKEIAQQATPLPSEPPAAEPFIAPPPGKTILINFTNVSMIEYLRFISRLTNKNFIFDENDLQFNVTIISEEPTSIETIMTNLLQELRIHDLEVIEEGNNLIIH